MNQVANTLSSRIDTDVLALMSRDTVAFDAHQLFDALRNHKGEQIVAAVAVAFAVVAERYGGTPEGLHDYGRRILFAENAFHDKANVQLEALRDYASLRMNSNPKV
jgi:hypothetical protein